MVPGNSRPTRHSKGRDTSGAPVSQHVRRHVHTPPGIHLQLRCSRHRAILATGINEVAGNAVTAELRPGGCDVIFIGNNADCG